MNYSSASATSPGPIKSDLMLWSMLRTRRKRQSVPKGLDAMANRWIGQLRHAPISLGYLKREARAIAATHEQWAAMSDRKLDERLRDLRMLFQRRKQRRAEVREALGAIRETVRRTTGEHPYPVQLMGALGLYHGQIIEMVTGEGKTLTAALGATLLAWSGRPVHLYTTNDYLAQRDADSRNPIYQRCGLQAGAIVGDTPPDQRAAMYQLPIVYATAREIMADWLRDRLKLGRVLDAVAMRWLVSPAWRGGAGSIAAPVTLVPGLVTAIVDEIDAILIDEAVTPLIIAQEGKEDAQAVLYEQARDLSRQLTARKHYTVASNERRARLTSAGREQVAQLLVDESHDDFVHPIWRAARLGQELVEQALTAEHCYHLGQHYQVIDDKMVIVDEYSGRIMADRQWQHGLHQAVEAKEELEITAEQQTLASISFQRFFRQYPHVCGMTGTAAEARPELERTYGRPVRVIPTHRPVRRQRWGERIYARADQKWQAVAAQVQELHQQGRPVLIGTRSVEASERVSALLSERGMFHQVLNAVRHKEEAQIIAQAGQRGAVTVATNMAGRGTDIKLGPGVPQLGGLHVILTERHTAQRVDRQFTGRAARQGDPGSMQIFVSLEDELLVRYLPRTARLLQWVYGRRRKPLPRRLVRHFIRAQRRATREALRLRLMMIRHEDELERTLPG